MEERAAAESTEKLGKIHVEITHPLKKLCELRNE